MKAWCSECGREVPPDYDGTPGHCPQHGTAKRLGEGYVRRRFREIHAAIDSATGGGKVYNDGVNYWTELEDRAAREKRKQLREDRAENARQAEFLRQMMEQKLW